MKTWKAFVLVWMCAVRLSAASYQIDTEFFSPIFSSAIGSLGGQVFKQATFRADGTCLVSGNFLAINGTPAFGRIVIDPVGKLVAQPHALGLIPKSQRAMPLSLPLLTFQGEKLIAASIYPDVEPRLIRYFADGRRDTAFQELELSASVSFLTTLTDGRILLSMNNAVGQFAGNLLLQSDGRQSSGRDLSGMFDGQIRAGLLLENGKLLVGGSFTNVGGRAVPRLIRLNADLSLDQSFVTDLIEIPNAIAIRFWGETRDILVGTDSGLRSLDETGRERPGSFRPMPAVRALHADHNGLIRCVVGDLKFWAWGAAYVDFPFHWQALNSDLFETPQLLVLSDDEQQMIIIKRDFVGPSVARLTRTGEFDNDFRPGFQPVEPIDLVKSGNNYIFYLGGFLLPEGSTNWSVLKFNWDGRVEDSVFRAPQLDIFPGRLLVSAKGLLVTVWGEGRPIILRLRSDGAVDPTFHSPQNVSPLAIQADGKLLVLQGSTLVRLLPDGDIDQGFRGLEGFESRLVAVQADGKIIVAPPLLRLNADGSEDQTFVPPPLGALTNGIQSIHTLADGTILLSGTLTETSDARNAIVALRANGEVDREFAAMEFAYIGYTGAKPFNRVTAMGASGDLYVTGHFNVVNDQVFSGIVRLIEKPKLRFDSSGLGFEIPRPPPRPPWSMERWALEWSTDFSTWSSGGTGFDGLQWHDETRWSYPPGRRFYRLKRTAP